LRDANSSAKDIKQLTRRVTTGVMSSMPSPESIGSPGGSAIVAVGELQSEETQKEEKRRAKRVQVNDITTHIHTSPHEHEQYQQ
jgi:hypothetical protein